MKDLVPQLTPAVRPSERLYWRSHPLCQRTGSDIFAALFESEKGLAATLLESPYPLPPDSLPEQATEMVRYSICAGAPRTVEGEAQLWTPELGSVLPLLRAMGEHSLPMSVLLDNIGETVEKRDEQKKLLNLPFIGGWLGWLGYDCAWEIERLPWLKDDALPFPVAYWYEPAEFAVLDHHNQRLWLAAQTADALATLSARVFSNATRSDDNRLLADLPSIHIEEKIDENLKAIKQEQPSQAHTYDLKLQTNQVEFEQAVLKAKAHIKAGDVFQVNHSLRFEAKTTLSAWEVYQRLHYINPSPFASYWRSPWGSVVSCSPERLVQLKAGMAQSRPIAGTRPRGKTVAEDEATARGLAGDRKECAEHIMLVDLERNDLGRVCKWGSVQVAELMTIERYSHVMHLVSNVVGQLGEDHSAAQLVASLFPGGTITGCPKVRCMEIIEALEPVRRSLFYGSCGYFDRRGHLDLNILIRTLLMAPADNDGTQTVWGQVGAGIVADSEPDREWRESLQKAKAQLLSLDLPASGL